MVVGMGLASVPGKIVLVPVVLVVHVKVIVAHRGVRVAVDVPLAEMQIHAGRHQRRRRPE
jgi:hypothetical protein